MKSESRMLSELVIFVLGGGVKRATKYISPKRVAKATFQGKRRKGSKSQTIILTVGAPNWREREFIKKLKKAGESFPFKKIKLQFERH